MTPAQIQARLTRTRSTTTWRERIQAARARGHFTEEDIDLATRSWRTCAVGEQIERYGTDVIHVITALLPLVVSPIDEELLRLGGTGPITGGFGWAVRNNAFDRAERLLDAIEDRALQLKREASP